MDSFFVGQIKKLCGPLFWIRFNFPKAAEPLLGESLLLTTKSRGVPGSHFLDYGGMRYQYIKLSLIFTKFGHSELRTTLDSRADAWKYQIYCFTVYKHCNHSLSLGYKRVCLLVGEPLCKFLKMLM